MSLFKEIVYENKTNFQLLCEEREYKRRYYLEKGMDQKKLSWFEPANPVRIIMAIHATFVAKNAVLNNISL